jgi:hypothetical protein
MFINNFITFVDLLINIWLSSCVACNLPRWEGNYSRIVFMDPSKVNDDEIQNQRKTPIETIYRHLDEFHYKDLILLPYNFRQVDCHLIIIANSI